MNDMIDTKMLGFFFEETKDMLESSMDDIIILEDGYDKSVLDNIMRAMHSIKGGSAMIELHAIEKFAHKLEDIFISLMNQEIELSSEIVDVMIESLNILKNWISVRESMLESEDFSKEIEEEVEETTEMLKKIDLVISGNSEKKEELKEEKEEKLKYITVYFDDLAPMFEVKRMIVKRALEESVNIINMEPSEENIMDSSINYYKILFKTKLEEDDIIRKIDTTDIYFIALDNEHLDNEKKNFNIYLKKEAVFENISIIYNNLLKILEEGNIKDISMGEEKVDIYGKQVFESLKK